MVWKLAVFCTTAPTEQYFSSERRMASATLAASISKPVITWNPDHREHLRPLRLIRLHPHLVGGDFLVIFLTQDGDHIERGASGQSGGDQFDGLGTSAAGCIVEQKIVAATGMSHKLALLLKWLSQFDLCCDHCCLRYCLR